ncbi:LLM class flavin-dependent oxidoreductase [Nonomuraea sp. 3-1Str]|uniref:LLM class flavin-dependent oxidoreductase n=1 Tax=Nonomuraea sp. 3-1Str TaxID=2929801 RepID=UPI00285B606A|nr:LLM class flavin-dependent oxidoreductase [Nonomuraea sp. 3-1Str]MDR8407285.1 LLM class flavin-dependent oxidoreductase [Nonomuraea sp. 3-1Str]
MTTPLSVLDLSPIPSGGSAADALRNTLDLARRADELGYHRYWLAEHHLAAGVAGSAPAVLIGLVAAATSRIRVGSGAVQLGHQTPLALVEQFGLIEALHPGRVDLGLGRSGHRGPSSEKTPGTPREPVTRAGRVVDGLLIPPPFDPTRLIASPRLAFQASLLWQPGGHAPAFADQVDDILAFLHGEYRAPEGWTVHAVPGEGADVEVWILGSSGGESARVAGERGLPFAANYHVSPATVLEAVAGYREAFKPSAALAEPYVIVSADVLVAPDDDTAAELAEPYGLWVRDIRTGAGAPPYPTTGQARAHTWSDEERALVQDRIDTRFVGTPERVAERLDVLRRVTGADELLVTTIAHGHAERVRSYELLAAAWHELDARTEGTAA